MTETMAKIRFNTATSRLVPNDTDAVTRTGDLILVFWKDQNRRAGPHKVVDVNNKVGKDNCDDQLQQFSLDRCKPYCVEEEIWDMMIDQENLAEIEPRKHAYEHERDGQDVSRPEFWDMQWQGPLRIVSCSNFEAQQSL